MVGFEPMRGRLPDPMLTTLTTLWQLWGDYEFVAKTETSSNQFPWEFILTSLLEAVCSDDDEQWCLHRTLSPSRPSTFSS
ncbi:hypothetical protein E2C01_101609 [Portunus trituberculatus]|uniref:Uncharacterized protein n=1 Tax=Portunus trituberculatus TaxID=210409 RepID=A0A5B7KFB1_PORTR|nr:hypothetical protein [Portunus trituberculatus]